MNNLRPNRGATKNRKIVGRGKSSGNGGRCGRGQKGQNARSGGGVRIGFEGGQMPLYRRIARRGFSNHPFRKRWKELHLSDIDRCFDEGAVVSPETLLACGLIDKSTTGIKVLAMGGLEKGIILRGVSASAAAVRRILGAGGAVAPNGKEE